MSRCCWSPPSEDRGSVAARLRAVPPEPLALLTAPSQQLSAVPEVASKCKQKAAGVACDGSAGRQEQLPGGEHLVRAAARSAKPQR